MLFFRKAFMFIFILAIVSLFSSVSAQENTEEGMHIIETKGHNFRLPEDWPVEKRNGIIAPIPVLSLIHI